MSIPPEIVWVNPLKLQIKLSAAGAPSLYGWDELAVRPESLLTIIPRGGEAVEAGLFALSPGAAAEAARAHPVVTEGAPLAPRLWALDLPPCDVRLYGVTAASGRPATIELGFLNLREALPGGRSLSLPVPLQMALARLFELAPSERWRATAGVLVRPRDPAAPRAALAQIAGLKGHPLESRLIALVEDPTAIAAAVVTRPDLLEQRLKSAAMFRDLPILALADDAFARGDMLRVLLDRAWRDKPVEMNALAMRNGLVVDMLHRLIELGTAELQGAEALALVRRGADLLADTKASTRARAGAALEAIEIRGSLVERPVEMMTANGPVLKGVIETRSGRMPFFAQGVSANTLKLLDPGDRIVALSRRLKIASQEYLKLEKVQVTSRHKDAIW